MDQDKVTCKDLFIESLKALTPGTLLANQFHVDHANKMLYVGPEKNTFDLQNGCYLVGFGKAVLGLGAYVSGQLGSLLNSGILSVPWGTLSIENHKTMIDACQNAGVKLIEGARDNLPDKQSFDAANEIVEMVSNLSATDVVIVLISGGGSALLPLPMEGITLEEKLTVVKLLSRGGASITELNTVRKALSAVKGGKLAQIISPAKTVSLVLSDIIGDPVDFIASGPTVPNTDDPDTALKIILKYDISAHISDNVKEVLKNKVRITEGLPTSQLYIVGNNEKVLNYIHAKTTEVLNIDRFPPFFSLFISDLFFILKDFLSLGDLNSSFLKVNALT